MISVKWITETVSSRADLARVDVREEVEGVLHEAELGVVALDLALGELAHRLDVTSSMMAVKIRWRGPWRWPTVTQTSWPLRYLWDLSPSRMVAVLRPLRSWSMKSGE